MFIQCGEFVDLPGDIGSHIQCPLSAVELRHFDNRRSVAVYIRCALSRFLYAGCLRRTRPRNRAYDGHPLRRP